MKQLVLALLCILIGSFLLTSCGSGGAPATSSVESSQPAVGELADSTDAGSADDASSESGSSQAGELEIVAFSSDEGAVTQGESTTLSWDVTGADSVTIDPNWGDVSGSSVDVTPITTTTYTLTATKAGVSTTASVTVEVLKGGSTWQVEESLPLLNRPTVIDVSKVPTNRVPFADIHCGGLLRKVNLSANEDAVVHMSGKQPLTMPLHVTGGRNVRVVGLQFQLETQPGCGIGELPNRPAKAFPNANIHPRVPGAIALRLQQSGTSFVEGLYIDVMGHEADCIVSRNPDSMSGAQAQKQRDVIIQNTVCKGVEGLGKTKIGEGVHGDLFQNQGRDVVRRLVFENVSHRTSQEGIVVHGGGGLSGTKSLTVRRYDYSWDPRFVGDDNYETFGLALAGRPGNNWTLEDVRIDDYRAKGNYVKINGQRFGDSPSSNVKAHPGIRSGLPPEGAFALPSRTGLNYSSPHGGVPSK